jgi:hypothetical protein
MPSSTEQLLPKFAVDGASSLQTKPSTSAQEASAPFLALSVSRQTEDGTVKDHSTVQPDAAAEAAASAPTAPECSDSGESGSTRSTSEVLPAAHVQALVTAQSAGSSAELASLGVAPVPTGWKSVLEKLIQAGPQAVQPASPYVPGSYGWGSGNSSTEHDTFSAQSEDAAHHDGAGNGIASSGGSGVSGAVVNCSGGGKAKKRRNKRAKNARPGA